MHKIALLTGQREVTAAGTPEKIKEAYESEKNKVIVFMLRTKTGNAGDIYITYGEQRAVASTTGDIRGPGELWIMDVSQILDAYIDLSKIWIDAATNGDGISYSAIEVV